MKSLKMSKIYVLTQNNTQAANGEIKGKFQNSMCNNSIFYFKYFCKNFYSV